MWRNQVEPRLCGMTSCVGTTLMVFVAVVLVAGGSVFAVDMERDSYVLSYHNGDIQSSWVEDYPGPISFSTFVWRAIDDPYYHGEHPHVYSDWGIEKLRFFHFGEGRYRIRIVLVDLDYCVDSYVHFEQEYETTCSDCWEEVVLDIHMDHHGGSYWPNDMIAVSFEPLDRDDNDNWIPRLAICSDEPLDENTHPHPYSSALVHRSTPGTWSIAWHQWFWEQNRGDYALDIHWYEGWPTSAENKTLSAVKSLY